MFAQSENNSQVHEDPEDNGFTVDFDAEFDREFDEQEIAAAPASAPVTEQQEEAGLAENNDFPDDFDAEFNREFNEQEAAAAPVLAPALATEQQAETMVAENESQVDEEAENNGSSDDFQTLLARVAADERKASQQHPSARLAQLMGMRVNEHGYVRPMCTIEERKAKQQAKQARRQAREQEAREKRIAGYKALGISKSQAICLD